MPKSRFGSIRVVNKVRRLILRRTSNGESPAALHAVSESATVQVVDFALQNGDLSLSLHSGT